MIQNKYNQWQNYHHLTWSFQLDLGYISRWVSSIIPNSENCLWIEFQRRMELKNTNKGEEIQEDVDLSRKYTRRSALENLKDLSR